VTTQRKRSAARPTLGPGASRTSSVRRRRQEAEGIGATRTEEEREAGLDDYAISTEAGATVYGGIRGCCISAGRLKLQLTEEAALELGMEAEMCVQLRDPTLDLPALREALTRILRPDLGGPAVSIEQDWAGAVGPIPACGAVLREIRGG